MINKQVKRTRLYLDVSDATWDNFHEVFQRGNKQAPLKKAIELLINTAIKSPQALGLLMAHEDPHLGIDKNTKRVTLYGKTRRLKEEISRLEREGTIPTNPGNAGETKKETEGTSRRPGFEQHRLNSESRDEDESAEENNKGKDI